MYSIGTKFNSWQRKVADKIDDTQDNKKKKPKLFNDLGF